MSLRDLQEAVDLIDKNGGDFEGEKDNALISKAENVLGVTFPPSYRKFLSTLGCGDIGGMEFYGLIGDDFENSGVPDAIWLTLEERKSGLPENLILVYATGDGAYYAIDTSQVDPRGECAIVSYEADGTVNKIANDYGEFILSKLKSILP